MKKAVKYLQNAKEILKNAPSEGKFYVDKKLVQKAFGIAFKAVLEAINEALLKKGVTKRNLPKSDEEYRKALLKYFATDSEKLAREYGSLYDQLYLAGCWYGYIRIKNATKHILEAAKDFINKTQKIA